MMEPFQYNDPKKIEELKRKIEYALMNKKSCSEMYIDYMMDGPKILVTDLARKKVVNKNYKGEAEVDVGFNEGHDMYSMAMCKVLEDKLSKNEIKVEKFMSEMDNITMKKPIKKLQDKMISKSYSKFKEFSREV